MKIRQNLYLDRDVTVALDRLAAGNQVERWFALLTQRQIRRASFVSAKDLVDKINAFVQAYNARAKPFVWTATSETILQKVERLCKDICGTEY